MNDAERLQWARALTLAGWMFVLAFMGFITWQIRRAFAITESSFEDGLWWQRVEQISFVSLPQNLVIMVPAAAAAVMGAVLVRPIVDPAVIRIRQLVRIVAGLSYVVIVIAVLGIIGIFFRSPDSIGDLGSFILRLGGILMSIGMITVCLEAERST